MYALKHSTQNGDSTPAVSGPVQGDYFFSYSEHYTSANLALNCIGFFGSQVTLLAHIMFTVN